MLKISQDQLDAYLETDMPAFLEHMAYELKASASTYNHLTIEALKLFADVIVRTAKTYGLHSAEQFGMFAHLMVETSPRFHQDGAFAAILMQPNLTADQKLEQLLADERADDWRRVDARMLDDFDREISFWEEHFDAQMLARLEAQEMAAEGNATGR